MLLSPALPQARRDRKGQADFEYFTALNEQSRCGGDGSSGIGECKRLEKNRFLKDGTNNILPSKMGKQP